MSDFDNLVDGKKESVFESKEVAQKQAERLFNKLIEYHKDGGILVYINKILNNNYYYIKYPRWKDLSELMKLFFVFQFGEDNSFWALSCRMSPSLCEKLTQKRNPEDFLRRRLNANFKNQLGGILQYCFTLEDLKNDAHLHGIIQSNVDKEKLKKTLKRTFLGKNYRNSSINNFCIRFEQLYDASGWLVYILKRNSFKIKLFPVYISRELNRLVQNKYQQLKGLK